MKYSLTLLLVIFSFAASAQSGYPFFNRINSVNHTAYFQQLKRLAPQKNIDSAYEAMRLVSDLSKYDSGSYNAAVLQPLLNDLNEFILDFFKHAVINNWRSEAMGSNWGGAIINPGKEIEFTSSTATFSKKDSISRTTGYVIIAKKESAGKLTYNRLLITFSDNKEEWALNFITPGNIAPFHGQADKLYLYFNFDQYCVCGCKNELYSLKSSIKNELTK